MTLKELKAIIPQKYHHQIHTITHPVTLVRLDNGNPIQENEDGSQHCPIAAIARNITTNQKLQDTDPIIQALKHNGKIYILQSGPTQPDPQYPHRRYLRYATWTKTRRK